MHLLSDKSLNSVQLARRFLRGALFCSVLTVAGCYSTARGPVIEAGAYSGPPIAVDSSQREHLAIMTAPSGGWRFTLDQVRDAFKSQRAYITIRRPNPGLYNTQQLVEQRVGTTVPRSTDIEVYARVIAFDDLSPEVPYHLATSAPGNPTPLPPPQREKRTK